MNLTFAWDVVMCVLQSIYFLLVLEEKMWDSENFIFDGLKHGYNIYVTVNFYFLSKHNNFLNLLF